MQQGGGGGGGGDQQGGGDGAATDQPTGATGTATSRGPNHVNGGRFDFDDGGTYCGGWEEGKAHGHGVCTGPKAQGAYSGSWHYGFEVSGVYTWPSGSCFEGQWQNGKRHGLGVETRGRWIYRGEWTQGFKGRYGVRQSNTSTAKYEGTWANGLQDGYGSETYADDGTYQGQWLRGMRHGYGVRNSAPFGKASKYRTNKTLRASLTSLRSNEASNGANNIEVIDKRDRRVDDSRGGFVLKMNSAEPAARRRSLGSSNIKKGLLMGLKLKKQRSTGDLEKRGAGTGSIRSNGSSASWVSTDSAHSAITNASIPSDSNASFVVENDQMDPNVTETYMGEWKNDKRSGFGISERSDGLRYEGEWYANKKYGYGVTTFSNGDKEEGKYKNNVLITSQKKKMFLMRSAKFRERIDAAVNAAQRASKIALQKADIAISRTATARGKAEQADLTAAQAKDDSDVAIGVAKLYAPDFKQPGLISGSQKAQERMRARRAAAEAHKPIHPTHAPTPPPVQSTPTTAASPPPPSSYSQQRAPSQPPPPSHMEHHEPDSTAPTPSTMNYDYETSSMSSAAPAPPPVSERRLSRRISATPTATAANGPTSIDHFDHYKRPPSRDPSVDRYARRMSSRQSSIEASTASPTLAPSPTDERARAPSHARSPTPVATNGVLPSAMHNANAAGTLLGGVQQQRPSLTAQTSAEPPFEDIIMRKRGLGQDIIPSPNQPKRTESLFIPGAPAQQSVKNVVSQTSLQRKKSLPDVQDLPRSVGAMSREEVSYLGAARREEVRRQADERERLRANPLLYLVSPQVKDWFSRQQLVIVVLFVNISLAIMFFKLLT